MDMLCQHQWSWEGWIQFSLVCKHHTLNHVREHTTHELLDFFFVTMIASLYPWTSTMKPMKKHLELENVFS
jgi:hypothetical protein